VVKKLRPESENPGEIVHVDGRVLGQHKGIIHYTIGQRKGLGIGGGHNEDNDPFYVIAIDPEENQVIVGPKQALARDIIEVSACNWLENNIEDGTEIEVKFRSVMKPVAAKLYGDEIHLVAPQYGIAPGQAAVCYQGGRVLGGGWIAGTRAGAVPLAA